MFVHDSNAHRRPALSQLPKRARLRLLGPALAGILGLSGLWSCASNTTGSADSGDSNGSGGNGGGGVTSGNGGSTTGTNTTSGSVTGGTTSGNGGSPASGSATGGTSGGGSGNTGNSGNPASGSATGGTTSGTSGSSGSPASGSATGGTASGTAGTSGIRDGGADATAGDGGLACTNTDMGTINIDSSGWACDNKWGIQGAWYCYQDPTIPVTAGGCAGTGVIPFNATSNAMCISGTTTATSNGSSYGAGLGLVLNQPAHGADAGKDAFNATSKGVVGFAITISGDSGGSVLNINLPPALTSAGESAAVTVPGVSSASSPVTYNVMIADAIVSDNATAPVPKIDATKLTDVQVAIPGADGVAHKYDFCITKIVPLMAAVAPPGSLSSYGASFTEGKQIALEGLGPYGIQNDPFGVGTDPMGMTASYGNGEAAFSASPTFGSTGNTPGAFPSIVAGWIHGGNVVSAAEGGYAGNKAISALTSVISNWSYTAGSGNWDAAYDSWLAANPNPINPEFELMVWIGHANVNPIGGQNTSVMVPGATGTWTVSNGTNGTGQPVVSYVSTSNMAAVTGFHLEPFFQEAAKSGRGGIGMGSILLGVQAGFELYNAGTWTTNSYSISIQ